MSARFVSTTRLTNIIQMISLAHQSGILRTTRGHSTARELGQIRFVDGQPVSALLGQLMNQAALNVLMNWGECLYLFEEDTRIEPLGGEIPRPNEGMSGRGGASSPVPTGSGDSWPVYAYGTSTPTTTPSQPFATSGPTFTPAPAFAPSGAMPPPGRASAAARQSQIAPGGPTDELDELLALASNRNPRVTATTAPQSAKPEEMATAVPVRTILSAQVDQLPLDRRERMVLLLIDGQRTVADLLKLVRRSEAEFYAVLHHLRRLGLIELRQ